MCEVLNANFEMCHRARFHEFLVHIGLKRQLLHVDIMTQGDKALAPLVAAVIGVLHRAQNPDALNGLAQPVHEMTEFPLAAFHDLVSLSGSLVLAFAVIRGWKDPEDIWTLSRLDEDWQEAQWGRDEEAAEQAALKQAAFLHADRFFRAS